MSCRYTFEPIKYEGYFSFNEDEMRKKIEYKRDCENEININFKTWLESNIQKIPQKVLDDLFVLLYDNVDKIKGVRPIVVGYLNVNG
jgi:hypothetical protein